jgi:DNA polymerase-1
MTKIALIDADIIVYEAAYSCQQNVEWDPGEVSKYADFEDAIDCLDASISQIEHRSGADTSLLALTDGAREKNFRRSVWPTYKCHRESKPGSSDDGRPLLYQALRQYTRENYEVFQKPGIEGDDTLGILATADLDWLPVERVICSVDKDLDNVPGWHFNWRKPEKGVYFVTEREADRNFMLQTLTGDATDGYPGIPGIGPTRAGRILDSIEANEGEFNITPQGLWWRAVNFAYSAAGRDEAYMMSQARCARILRASDWDQVNQCPILWTPPEEWL